jgi:ABC-type transporter Mla maintaining outer membrane lipid asymmetry ATPase subunit MlaF
MADYLGRRNKIEVKNLTRQFGDLLVLDNINFTVAEGEQVPEDGENPHSHGLMM